jgi:hypothetical protein
MTYFEPVSPILMQPFMPYLELGCLTQGNTVVRLCLHEYRRQDKIMDKERLVFEKDEHSNGFIPQEISKRIRTSSNFVDEAVGIDRTY